MKNMSFGDFCLSIVTIIAVASLVIAFFGLLLDIVKIGPVVIFCVIAWVAAKLMKAGL